MVLVDSRIGRFPTIYTWMQIKLPRLIPIHVKIHSLQLSWEWSIHTITVGLHWHAKLLPNFSWDVNSIRHSNVNFKILLNTYQRRLKHDYGTNLKSFYSRHSYNIYNVKSNSSSSFTPCSKGVTNNSNFLSSSTVWNIWVSWHSGFDGLNWT